MDNFDMDEDFLGSLDPIQKFLTSKLKLLEAEKLELTKKLERRQSIMKETITKSTSATSKHLLKVDSIWKKIVNNKYVIGMCISGADGRLGEVDVILTWKDKAPLNYNYFDASKHSFTADLQTIIIIIPLPTFTQTTSLYIDGILTYSESQAHQVVIPTITLEASDVTNDAFLVKKHNVLMGDRECLLALIAANEETKVFLYFHRANHRNIDDLLEMDCSFRRIDVNDGCLFYAGEASDYFDGAVLQNFAHEQLTYSYLNLYTKNVDQLLAILHHLYKNNSDVVILPLNIEKHFCNHMSLFTEPKIIHHRDSLIVSLQEEVSLVEEFFERYRIHCDNSDDVETTDKIIVESYKKFRHALNEQEMKSDVLYSAVNNYVVVADDASDVSL